ncbi:GNAT family N-acetyltransferase [Novosphingobium sp. CF614]|uniref:GNAT family N-acetyltransferase n=1 Tax=Novosphingobium sp. CF614 TaxID=1884364 RepID=UPI000B888980
MDDLPALHEVMRRAIERLQTGFLTAEQVRASHQVMGLDSQLVKDGTYFIVMRDGRIAGCGGWSFRATLYGGDASMVARAPESLDPACDAARIRAMYTDPDFARRGVGRQVMALCEGAAWDAGFRRTEMMATMAGMPLYRSCGYEPIDAVHLASIEGVEVPLQRMGKQLAARP